MDLIQLAQSALAHWPYVLFQDALRYFMFVPPAFLIVWTWKGKAWKHRRTQSKELRSKQFTREILYSLSTIFLFSLVGTSLFLAKSVGLLVIYDDPMEYGLLYLLISPIVLIVLHDAYFYWSHRFLHLKPVFRIAHAVHHKSTSPSPWATYAFHPLEALTVAAFYPVTLAIIPFHPFVLLGFVTFMILRNIWGHLGYELLPRSFVSNKWLNWNTSTTHHDLHHSSTHANFGLYFTWWDRWMDTEHPEYQEIFEKITTRKPEQVPELNAAIEGGIVR